MEGHELTSKTGSPLTAKGKKWHRTT